MYLVELLVALSVGAMITFALLNTMGTAMRHASATQNEVYANTIIRELIEATRATSYSDLELSIGTHDLLVNRESAGELGPSIREEPVQLDIVNKTWHIVSQSGRFRGDVEYKIENGPDVETLRVTVTVSWSDSIRTDTSSSGRRSISGSTIVTKLGSGAYGV